MSSEKRIDTGNFGGDPRGTKRKISLSNCSTCEADEARYKCPRCLKHSCSLICVKKHKMESKCNGIRDKTAFVPLGHYDEINVLNDYRFLEETGRMTDSARRDSLAHNTECTARFRRLIGQAKRRNVTLKLLPRTFSRSQENSTFTTKKDNQIFWHVKLLFPQSCSEFTQKRVPEDQLLEDLLTPYIHPTKSDPVTRQKLKIYVQAQLEHLRVFMQVEGMSIANSLRYYELDMRKSLIENLSNKTVIEFPVLHIVLNNHCQNYLMPRQGVGDTTVAQ